MKIKAVNGADPEVASLLRWLQLATMPRDDPYDTGNGFWWVAYEGTEPIGFAGMVRSFRWSDAGYLCRAGVVRAYRGKGLQKRLIKVRERKARRLGWNWLITDTASYNVASSNSLLACGFKLFRPSNPWGHEDGLYWRKELA
jgi:GNAT superfamily N-acetyltransferase